MSDFHRCRPGDFAEVLDIINAAAVSYRGVIPPEHWHEPYMSAAQLQQEISASVEFWSYLLEGRMAGIMGFQSVQDVDLIRHAYVRPEHQGRGIGGQLLTFLRQRSSRPLLIGTWAAASDAIRFYERHGFAVVPPSSARRLLLRYWDVSEAQIADSLVLAEPT